MTSGEETGISHSSAGLPSKLRKSWRPRLAVLHRGEDHANPFGAIALFLLPALLVYAAFTALPVIRTFYNSLHKVLPNRADEYIGFANYAALWGDKIFWRAVENTLTWALAAPVLEVTIATLLALCLYARGARRALLSHRLVYAGPDVLRRRRHSLDLDIQLRLGCRELGPALAWSRRSRHALARSSGTALPALILVTTWMWVGFNMVVVLAAMSSLPAEVLEAAELDNCGWFKKLWFVVLPMIRPTLLNLLVLSFIGKMKIFDLVWVTTQGNPLWATETVSTYVYKRAVPLVDLRSRLSFDHRGDLVRHRSGRRAAADLSVPSARQAGVLRMAFADARPLGFSADSLKRLGLMLILSLYTAYAAGPFLWVASMSLRTTTEIAAEPYACRTSCISGSSARPGSGLTTTSISPTA